MGMEKLSCRIKMQLRLESHADTCKREARQTASTSTRWHFAFGAMMP